MKRKSQESAATLSLAVQLIGITTRKVTEDETIKAYRPSKQEFSSYMGKTAVQCLTKIRHKLNLN